MSKTFYKIEMEFEVKQQAIVRPLRLYKVILLENYLTIWCVIVNTRSNI